MLTSPLNLFFPTTNYLLIIDRFLTVLSFYLLPCSLAYIGRFFVVPLMCLLRGKFSFLLKEPYVAPCTFMSILLINKNITINSLDITFFIILHDT